MFRLAEIFYIDIMAKYMFNILGDMYSESYSTRFFV